MARPMRRPTLTRTRLAAILALTIGLTTFAGTAAQGADGRFTPTTPPTVATGGQDPNGIETADFNGDGSPDIATANRGSDDVSILLSDGDGTFTPATPATIATGDGPQFVDSGDFDEDGDLDLVVTNNLGNNVSILLGNGDGSFTAPAPATYAVPTPGGVAIADFNGDAHEDLAVLHRGDAKATILLGGGDGTFSASPTLVSTSFNAWGVVSDDFNGDRLADLAITVPAIDAVLIRLGNGAASSSRVPTSRWATLPTASTSPTSTATGIPTWPCRTATPTTSRS